MDEKDLGVEVPENVELAPMNLDTIYFEAEK